MTEVGDPSRGPVGVVGAGTMGRGVSHAFAAAGYDVVLVDLSDQVLAGAIAAISADVRMRAMYGLPAAGDVVARITATTRLEALAPAQYLVENITEVLPAKERLYRSLAEICDPECVFGVNTSAIPITRLASVTSSPGRFVGNHFMNPAFAMPVVEIVRGLHTGEATIDRARAVLASIGKDSIVVADSPGFVTNRVAMLSVNEAVSLLAEGVCDARGIDRLFRQCLGHRMGPLETADLIGLDTVLLSLEVLRDEFGDQKFSPSPVLRRYVKAGWTGRKAGRGFHAYAEPTSERRLESEHGYHEEADQDL